MTPEERTALRQRIAEWYERSCHDEARILLILGRLCDEGVPIEKWPEEVNLCGGPAKNAVERLLARLLKDDRWR